MISENFLIFLALIVISRMVSDFVSGVNIIISFLLEVLETQSVGSNALNLIQMVPLPDYIEFLQYKARKQISSGLAPFISTDSNMTCVSNLQLVSLGSLIQV